MSRLNSAVRSFIRSRRVQAAAIGSGAAEEFARSYVAGSSAAETLEVAEQLRGQGLLLSLAYLPVTDHEEETTAMLIEALQVFGETARGAEISVKPSSLGLRADERTARDRLGVLCEAAEASGAVVTLEMQGELNYEATLVLWDQCRRDHTTLGLTLPADIRGSEAIVGTLGAGERVRLCIGSYPVSQASAYRDEQDKALALVRCLRRAMSTGAYPMLASHDPTIIAIAQEMARRFGIAPEGFEFQMFYGVRPLEHRRLADIGFRSRTYLPFGPAWFEYLSTRIAARPRTLLSYLRAISDKR